MKPMIKLILLLTLFSSFLIANNTDINFTTEEKLFIKNNPVIKVGAETDWPPFDFVENGKYTGLAKDYLDIIEKLTGLKFEYDIDTWSNLLKKAKNKELDLLPILSKTEERQKFLLYTNEYLEIRDYIFTNDPKLNSLEKVKDKVIVIPRGFVQEEYFKKNYPQIKIYYVNNLLEAIDSIITKKADFLVANVAIINYLLKKYNITELKATSHVDYSGSKLHMAVRNDYKILHSIIQKALDNISLKEKNIISTNWLNIKKQRGNSNLKLTDEELNFIKNKKRIIIANEFDWIPYDFNEDSQAKGYVIDYVKILAEKLGLEPIFVTDKWNNLLQKTRLGEIDILPVLTINKKREEFLFFTKSILDQKLSIITNKTRNDIINLDDLKNKKVAMMKGYASTNLLRKAFPKINVIEFDSLYDIFDAVKNNFVDATIQNNMIAQYYINKNYLEYLKLSSNVIIPITIQNCI